MTLKEQFVGFHRSNPDVYQLFKRFAIEAANSGMHKFSARMIIERIRWHTRIETEGSEYKMPNICTPYYARLLMVDRPDLAEFFNVAVMQDPISEEELRALLPRRRIRRRVA